MNPPNHFEPSFCSVAELGYAFSDTPWKNMDFSFPESGDAALLDVFCINEVQSTDGLVAGRINLNSRQEPALKAVLAGAITQEGSSTGLTSMAGVNDQAGELAKKLAARTAGTSTTLGPLINRSDLVGRWSYSGAVLTTDLKAAPNPDSTNSDYYYTKFYSGFSEDIGRDRTPLPNYIKSTTVAFIPRQRESAIRALADVGTTRVWNLMIDVVAQSGRYPVSAQNFSNFVVEGEKRYWLHIAIDRLTGKVLDQQLEIVTE